MIHRLLGCTVVLVWLWTVYHLSQVMPGLHSAESSGVYRAGRGAIYVLGLPLLAAALLIFPDFFEDRFSPVSRMTGEALLSVGVWRFFGYFALLVSWGLWELFR
ncbi:hypothetical protein [Dyella tabacisoli]|uniref:Uncharacterized protein n=1 Tax=Dyella tabacisoli TaxID=2282381 RepID=A0A369UHN1_9GAMM|nr:hypothetical protein [Dyella tabacisoli]RDD79843.1 hypothetical protein DVJ77_20490 [Dyella tabacisoli]